MRSLGAWLVWTLVLALVVFASAEDLESLQPAVLDPSCDRSISRHVRGLFKKVGDCS